MRGEVGREWHWVAKGLTACRREFWIRTFLDSISAIPGKVDEWQLRAILA
jgi:hypothetical protein